MKGYDMDKLPDQVYRLHRCGHAVSKIARQLSLKDDVVRGFIVDRWRRDKESEGGELDNLRSQ